MLLALGLHISRIEKQLEDYSLKVQLFTYSAGFILVEQQTVEALLESGHSLTKEQKLIMESKLSKEYMKNMDE